MLQKRLFPFNQFHDGSKNPKSGQKEIIPIAPHSLQASDYRPRKRAGGHREKADKAPPYPEVEVEPVSVEQMEREFKIANRKLNRRGNRRGFKSFRFRLLNWLKGLFKRKKDRPARGKGQRNRKTRGGKGRPGGQGKPPRQQQRGSNPQEGQQSSRRRRRRRSRGGGQEGQAGGSQQQAKGGAPSQRQGDGGSREGQSQGKGKSRNRRNRRRGPRQGNQGNQGNSNSGNAQ